MPTKTIFHIIQGFLFIFVSIILFIFFGGSFSHLRDTNAYVILSGSMEPEVPVGSVIFTRRQPFYKKNEIISFSTTGQKNDIVTHRISEIHDSKIYYANPSYITKGDANKTSDQTPVDYANVKGKVFLTVPYLGYIVNFAKTVQGFILFVVIPATIIIYEEMKSVYYQLHQIIKNLIFKYKKSRNNNSNGEYKNNYVLRYIAIPIPVIGAVMIVFSLSISYFIDQEKSSGNTLGAAESFGPQYLSYFMENKNINSDWSVIAGDAIDATLQYVPDGTTFDYKFRANGLVASHEYCLIYYADGWPGNNPGALLNHGFPDSYGKLILNGNSDIGISMPEASDANYPTGAKIWLLPCSQYNISTRSVIGWSPSLTEWLFDNGSLVKYKRIMPSPALSPTVIPPNSTTVYLNQLGGDISSQYGYNFDYTNASNNNVSFTYLNLQMKRLSGLLKGSGLKPYATYQTKLTGIPVCKDGAYGNDTANEYIGFKGRWYCISNNCSSQSASARNRTDAQYIANKAKPDSDPSKECLVGYLVFDYFTANSSGNVNQNIQTANSYHVLWCGGGTCNTSSNTYLSYLDPIHSGVQFCPSDKVNGQLERFTCQGMDLDPGNYHLQLSITEESFHQGNWATILSGDIDFVIN